LRCVCVRAVDHTSCRCPSASYSYVFPSSSSLVVLCEPSQNGWFLERPHMQIQTDSACGLISSGLLSDLTTLRIAKVMLLEIRRKLATSVCFVSQFAAGGEHVTRSRPSCSISFT